VSPGRDTPRHAHPTSRRRTGREVKAAIWTARHPGSVVTPATLLASGTELGWTATGGILGGTAAGLCAWYRSHPDSFDYLAAPRMRAWRRRWSVYLGPRWNNALRACDLYPTHRKTGEERFPRIIKVRAYSPTVDTLFVRLVPGQHLRQFEARLPELTETLKVERIGLERVKPGVIGLVIERSEPFTDVFDAPDLPYDADAVNLTDLYIGETEFGGDWRLPIRGQHLFGAGATGAGKNSIVTSIQRGIAPLIRDGLVRLWICDPKQLEFAKLREIAYRYADDGDTCRDLVDEYVEDMQATPRLFAGDGVRKLPISQETPFNLLILDELGALLAYGTAPSPATCARNSRSSARRAE
jgi:S-DNA-T family DNA segregation ATPase FtsK/SpoIIIE